MVRAIDLNADVGEECADDEALLAIVTSVNVATGAHAGGGEVLDRTVALAARAGCSVGAHPSYRDRMNFGRVSPGPSINLTDVADDLVLQVMAVADACARHGVDLTHVKAHGALYNDAADDDALAEALTDTVRRVQRQGAGNDIALLGPPASAMERAAARAGIRFVREAFADRAYAASGRLVPRSAPHAVLDGPGAVVARAVALAEGRAIAAVDGTTLVVESDSICLHGDTPGAVHLARAVRHALESAGIAVRAAVVAP